MPGEPVRYRLRDLSAKGGKAQGLTVSTHSLHKLQKDIAHGFFGCALIPQVNASWHVFGVGKGVFNGN